MPSLVTRGIASRLLCVVVCTSSLARADCAVITRRNVVACALEHSPLLTAELASARAAEGRREAARPFLPSNPSVIGSLASRTGADARALNWSVTVSQELEIAGQNGLRVDVAEGELSAQQHHIAVARAAVAEQAWLGWFDAAAAKERAELAVMVEQASLTLAATVQGMATQGLASQVEAAVADAAAVQASFARLEAEREVSSTAVRLRTLLGAPGEPQRSAELEPLVSPAARVPSLRAEVLALEAAKRSAAQRIELLRRSRAPNPTLSLFAQNDGFDERVFGVSVGVPIPLPQPVGRTRAGEVVEAAGQGARLEAELDQLNRTFASELELAAAAWRSSVEARGLFTPDRVQRARQALTTIAAQLAAARLGVRDALTDQRLLMELLKADVDSRHGLCVASVRLQRAAGASLEGGDL